MSGCTTKVLITIDTEFSMGGYYSPAGGEPVSAEKIIFCRIGNEVYGISRIMDILERYGFRGVFFVETEARFYFGEKAVVDVCTAILSRGHEVQLHIHPAFRSFIDNVRIKDDLRLVHYDDQVRYIGEARMFLERNGITDVTAFRAGGFYSTAETARAAFENGFLYVSNCNPAFPNCDYIPNAPFTNRPFEIEGVREFPVTCMEEIPVRKQWNPFQLSAASYSEMKKALEFYHANCLEYVTFITHSFEFVKKYDSRYEKSRPLPFLIKRFETLCRYLAENSDKYTVTTFSQIDRKAIRSYAAPELFYTSTLWDTVVRYGENTLGTVV